MGLKLRSLSRKDDAEKHAVNPLIKVDRVLQSQTANSSWPKKMIDFSPLSKYLEASLCLHHLTRHWFQPGSESRDCICCSLRQPAPLQESSDRRWCCSHWVWWWESTPCCFTSSAGLSRHSSSHSGLALCLDLELVWREYESYGWCSTHISRFPSLAERSNQLLSFLMFRIPQTAS